MTKVFIKLLGLATIYCLLFPTAASSRGLDLGIKGDWLPKDAVVHVFPSPNKNQDEVSYLEDNSYVITSPNPEKGKPDWVKIQYNTLSLDDDCLLIMEPGYRELRQELVSEFQKMQGKQQKDPHVFSPEANDAEMKATINGVLMKFKNDSINSDCFKRGEGWVLKAELKKIKRSVIPNIPAAPAPRVADKCENCEVKPEAIPQVAKPPVTEAKKNASELLSKAKEDSASEPAGKKLPIPDQGCRLNHAVSMADWEMDQLQKVRANHQLRGEKKIKKETEIKNRCMRKLQAFYDHCSPYREMSFRQKIAEVSKISRKVAATMPSVNPNWLTCIAFRESSFNPIAVNPSACRLRGEKNSRNKLMKGWESSAIGMDQNVLSTMKDLWDRCQDTLSKFTDKHTPDDPVNFQKYYYGKDELQIAMMACHLKLKYEETGDRDRAFLKYDSDQKDTWVPGVRHCQECLNKGNEDVETCIRYANPPKHQRRIGNEV